MHPVLIDLGGFELHSYGAMAAFAFLVVVFVALRDADAHDWDRDLMVDLLFYGSIAGIVGARGLFFLQNPALLESPWSVVDMRTGGMVFYGAPLLGLPVSLWLLQRYRMPLWAVADTFARTLPLAHGLSRIGCFAAGCCYGLESDAAWAVTFSDPMSAAPIGVALHPVQLYEASGLFLISAFCFWLLPRKQFHGQVFLAYLSLYAVLRSIVELWRGDADRYFVVPDLVSTSQGISIGMLLVVGALWWKLRDNAVAADA